MSTKNTIFFLIVLILATFGGSLVLSTRMPESMASHWNAQGQVDGYSSRTFGLYYVPAMQLGLALLFLGIPLIDPRKENIRKFRPVFNLFIIFIVGFFSYIHGLTLVWNLGVSFALMLWMSPAMALLLFLAGVLIHKAQPNFFIGIRTPWTLSDDRVWNETHRMGGWAFKACGLLSLLGMISPAFAIVFLLVPVLVAAFGLILYSYILYRKYHPNIE